MRRKMKKTLTMLAMAAILTSFTGCESTESESHKQVQAEKTQETPIPVITATATSTPTATATPAVTSTPVAVPTIAETEMPKDGSYIIEGSDSRMLTQEEVSAMDANLRQMAINEIYARHGRKFKDQAIQDYFNAKAWYTPSVEPEAFSENVFNQYEKSNISLLSGQSNTNTSNASMGSSCIDCAGKYYLEYSASPLKFCELNVSLYTDPGLFSCNAGDCVGEVDFYDTEYFPDGVNQETNYEHGYVYLVSPNVYTVQFDSEGIFTMTVDEGGVTLSNFYRNGYYTLVERFHS